MSNFEGQTIYLDAAELRRLVSKALLMMTKQYRVEVGARAMQATGDIIADFVMAYEFKQERYWHFKRLCARFEVLKIDLRMIVNDGLLQSPHPVTHERPETIALQMFERVASIDEAIGRWKTKIVVRQARPSPQDDGSSD